MVSAPVNLTYGTVTGKYLLSILDSNDADRYPDYVAATGTVTFTPAVRSYKNLSLPATFATSSIACTIDSFGDLRDPSGALGVVLVASDNTDMQPRDWTYTVQVNVSGSVETFSILVTGGSVIDLTIVGPAASSAGTAVVVSSADRVLAQQAAAAAAQSAIDAAEAGGGGGGLNIEAVQDAVGAMTTGTGYAVVTYNDGAGTLTVGTTTALQTALDDKAPLVSPSFSGSPTAPTPTAGDNDTSIATTAFVTTAVAAKASLASPAFSGNPTAPTPSAGDNDTSIATTAFVGTAMTSVPRMLIYTGSAWPSRTTSDPLVPHIWIDYTGSAPDPSGFIEGSDLLWQTASI